jgi:hypothetical protein
MFWKLFGSNDSKIEEALEKSVGHDICLNAAPANTDTAAPEKADADPASLRQEDNRVVPQASSKLELWTDYAMVIPANTETKKQDDAPLGTRYAAPWERKKAVNEQD